MSIFDENNNLLESTSITVDSSDDCKSLSFHEFENLDDIGGVITKIGSFNFKIMNTGYVKYSVMLSERTAVDDTFVMNFQNFGNYYNNGY